MQVRTRFAPSPTGFLHVGSVRTALFSWLFAKHHQGVFILRVEDTDHERSTQESVQAILDGLDWLGIHSDEGPFYQTDRYERYHAIANELLEKGLAYRCQCSKERLSELRDAQVAAKQKPRYDGHCRDKHLQDSKEPYVVRFKNPQTGVVCFSDEVYGDIQVENSELDDLVLVRSDGHPTYNFAVVIDDWDMQISHVIRGDDHINNTPRQINLFKALGAPIPIFAHLPMILGDDGKRLSKRHGAVSVLEFREQGILPHALLNYLVRLGWSCGDQEIFSLEEMQRSFNLKHVSRGVSSFNYEKLYWLNQHYLKSEPAESMVQALRAHFQKAGLDCDKGPDLKDLVALQAERCKTLVEICEKSHYFYQDEIAYDEDAVKKHLRPVVIEPMTRLYELLKGENNWTAVAIHEAITQVCTEYEVNMGKIGQPLRVAVTGTGQSPTIDQTMALIGKARSLARLDHALSRMRERAEKA